MQQRVIGGYATMQGLTLDKVFVERGVLGGAVPWGYAVSETGDLVPVPEQQAAIRRMRKLRDQGLALRVIAAQMKAAGVSISHAGVANALRAADRQPPVWRAPGHIAGRMTGPRAV